MNSLVSVCGWWVDLLLSLSHLTHFFGCPTLRDYFPLVQADLHWPGLALHLSRTSRSEKMFFFCCPNTSTGGLVTCLSSDLSSVFSFCLFPTLIFTGSWQKTPIKILSLLRQCTYHTHYLVPTVTQINSYSLVLHLARMYYSTTLHV